ncbi:hypothetical protein AJ80_05844 [Polytolypa hystricis UAMH7299]|uniref:Borealin N-terminal domain-containing protein n=1 Tax=Polytolypa hystricis (strain UAMH7299) TaxID=1447883 RepID=A0A2B7Y0V3_POLH7|nr:hypothetical protein AJ80_05844 [Polytolypa hystricis UAMH7299]
MASFSRKRKTPEPEAHNTPRHALADARTPTGSPAKKRLKVTQSQKQALMDNLQLEITERARKLRAHYALQAQDLRSRIERRVNRIPVALRKAKMGDLLTKHTEAAQKAAEPEPAFKKPAVPSTTKAPKAAARTISKDATAAAPFASDDLHASDKENAPYHDAMHLSLPNPKKRATPAAAPGKKPTAGPSRVAEYADTRILSPKSSNSRTFPNSPLRNPSSKSQPRSTSPLKQSSPVKDIARTRTTRGATSQTAAGRRTGAAPSSRPTTRQQHTRTISQDTTSSTTSSGTTIIKPSRTAAAAAASPRKVTTTAASSSVGATKKVPTTKRQAAAVPAVAKKTTAASTRKAQATIEQPAPGRRVLRKRV